MSGSRRSSRPAIRAALPTSSRPSQRLRYSSQIPKKVRNSGPVSMRWPASVRRRLLPPRWEAASRSVTRIPALASKPAAARPPRPPPTTTAELILGPYPWFGKSSLGTHTLSRTGHPAPPRRPVPERNRRPTSQNALKPNFLACQLVEKLLRALSAPGSGAEYVVFVAFWPCFRISWTADRTDNHFFNTLTSLELR